MRKFLFLLSFLSTTAISQTAPLVEPWPEGIIPYHFHVSFPSSHRSVVKYYMKIWEVSTGVKFKEESSEAPGTLSIQWTANNCSSTLGFTRDAVTFLAPRCMDPRIVLHELGHVLGLFHEHTREDRDLYVTIKPSCNGRTSDEFRFNILQKNFTWGNFFNIPYDLDSIMHYQKDSFSYSVYCPTLLPKKKHMRKMGGDVLSKYDILKVKLIYKQGP